MKQEIRDQHYLRDKHEAVNYLRETHHIGVPVKYFMWVTASGYGPQWVRLSPRKNAKKLFRQADLDAWAESWKALPARRFNVVKECVPDDYTPDYTVSTNAP